MNREIRPPDLAPPAAAYAHAVVSDNARRLLHTSGVVPIAPDGSVPTSIEDQAAVVWANLRSIVAAAQMRMTDVVSVTTYVVVGQPLAAVMEARDRALDGHRAASTLVTVPALARPEWLMEIALVAAAES
ncbi:MAG: RidA family protein [Ilumatobacteraceae bacterium]